MPRSSNPFGGRNQTANEETIGVVGKRFPSTHLSDIYARFPALVMVICAVLPIAFTFIAIGADVAVDVSLDGFTVDPHESTSSANRINSLTEAWIDVLFGAADILSKINPSHPRSTITYRQELRFDIDTVRYYRWYYSEYQGTKSYDTLRNILALENLATIRDVERDVQSFDYYKSLCFTNNLKYGVLQNTYPVCAPVTSVTQYFFPGSYTAMSGATIDWEFSGQGTVYQLPYSQVVTALTANPNYKWFVDKGFSNVAPVTRSVRTQITFAKPATWGAQFDSYQSLTRRFIGQVETYVANFSHPYIVLSFGGDQVEESRISSALDKEYYKLALAILIVACIVYIHVRTAVVTFCIVLQLLFTYMGSWGVYIKVFHVTSKRVVTVSSSDSTTYESLPLLSSISFFLIISFCLHGTLTFYDTFTHSGIMSTTGRRNNLSVSQRIAFTMRRASGGITIANTVAIIIFAINTSSAFQAVASFSSLMIFALLFNIYFSWTLIPGYVLWHHYYFSRKRRWAQKQREVVEHRSEELRRHRGMNEVLEAIQMNLKQGEEHFVVSSEREYLLTQLEETRMQTFLREGPGNLLADARREIDEVIKVVKENRQEAAKKAEAAANNPVPTANHILAGRTLEFDFEMFAVANGNSSSFISERLVRLAQLTQFPLGMTTRSAENFALATEVAEFAQAKPPAPQEQQAVEEVRLDGGEPQRENSKKSGTTPPPLSPRPTPPTSQQPQPPTSKAFVQLPPECPTEADCAAFFDKWQQAAHRLRIVNANEEDPKTLSAVLAYQWCCAHDPMWIVSEAQGASSQSSHRLQVAAAPTTTKPGEAVVSPEVVEQHKAQQQKAAKQATEEYNNFFGKLKYRWERRTTEERQYCFGMFGKRVNETREERDARILARVSKQENYGRMERFFTQRYAPFVDRWKIPLVIAFFVITIAFIVLSTRVKTAGIPKTLMHDVTQATQYAKMGNVFAQSGNCDFCGLYYRPRGAVPSATLLDLTLCAAQGQPNQMYQFVDRCLICQGTNACLGCDGMPNSWTQIQPCGVCGDASSCGTCLSTASCTWCQLYNQSTAALAGPNCGQAARCNTGATNPFTGTCDCTSASQCTFAPKCTYRGMVYTSATAPFDGCGCVGNWLGPSCNFCACRNGGTCSANGTCICPGPFIGDQCQYCSGSCSLHGRCPQPLSPLVTNIRSCVGTHCNASSISSDIPCSECATVAWIPGKCGSIVEQQTCNSDTQCYWLSGKCVENENPNTGAITNATCQCNGAWSGPRCDVCGGPAGSTCTLFGDVVACDGLTYLGGVGAPVLDGCGVCGGSSDCVGCDGVLNSGKHFDSCGVCGGSNACLSSSATSPLSVTFLFDFTASAAASDILDSHLVTQSVEACRFLNSLSELNGTLLLPTSQSCIMADYAQWQVFGQGSTTTKYGKDYSASGLYTFAAGAHRLAEVGFSTNNINASNFRLQFIKMSKNTALLTTASNEAIYALYESMLQLANDVTLSYFTSKGLPGVDVIQTSTSWANAVAAHVSVFSLKFTAGVGTAVMFAMIASAFGNIRLGLFSALGVVFTLCGILTIGYGQGWDIDAVMQISVAGVIAIAAEHLVHIIDGYQDFLQSTQSHMFAVATTRMHAFRGALTRTGVSLISSTVAVILVAFMFITSDIQPFRRAAEVTISLHVLIFFAAMLFFGSNLCLHGPLRLFRHWAASTVMCCLCSCCGGIALLIIYLAHGVIGPSGYRVP